MFTLDKLSSVSLGLFFLNVWATEASKISFWGDQYWCPSLHGRRGFWRCWTFRVKTRRDLGKLSWGITLPLERTQFCEVFLRLGSPSKKKLTSDALWNPPCFWKILKSFPLHHLCRHGAKGSAVFPMPRRAVFSRHLQLPGFQLKSYKSWTRMSGRLGGGPRKGIRINWNDFCHWLGQYLAKQFFPQF